MKDKKDSLIKIVKNEDIADKELLNALTDFKKKYPSSTSADMQTFVIAWKACVDNYKKKSNLGW